MHNSFKRSLLLTTVLLMAEPMSAAFADDCAQQIATLQAKLSDLQKQEADLRDTTPENDLRKQQLSAAKATLAADTKAENELSGRLKKEQDAFDAADKKYVNLRNKNLPNSPANRKALADAEKARNDAQVPLGIDLTKMSALIDKKYNDQKEVDRLSKVITPDQNAINDVIAKEKDVTNQITALQKTCTPTPTPTGSPTPTVSPTPTNSPTPQPTPQPTATPTRQPPLPPVSYTPTPTPKR